MNRPLALLLAFAALFLSESASAQSVRGFIVKGSGGSLELDVSAGEAPYSIVTVRPDVESQLKSLKPGDFLVARGFLDPMISTASLDSIESVGLQELIGPWEGTSSRVFDFEDFSRLNLYKARLKTGVIKLSKLREMNYSVAPEAGGRFSIFMSDNRSVNIGFIEFNEHGLVLTMIDPKTGRVSENISLSPLPVK